MGKLWASITALFKGTEDRDALHFFEDRPYQFTPAERGVIPGTPPVPDHPLRRRPIYFLTSLLVSITAALGNGMVSANLPYLQGSLGLDLSEIVWLTTAFLITTSITGCILVKFRQQFGIRNFCIIFLVAYVVLIIGHLGVKGLASAVAVRAGSGVCGVALTALGVYYMQQAIPRDHKTVAVAIGISMPQLALPLARVLPKDMLAYNNWTGLYLFELGLSLLTLAAVICVRLPPPVRERAFERLDIVSFSAYGMGVLFFGAAVGLGPYVWWTDTPWIGWALAFCIPSFVFFGYIEFHRKTPLIDVRWLSAGIFLRWTIVAIVCRFVVAEQTGGVVTLLHEFGLTNDDFWSLSFVILLASCAGTIAGAFAVSRHWLREAAITALVICFFSVLADSSTNDQTRAAQFYWTQAAISFATTMFVAPFFLIGMAKVIAQGGTKMTSFIALYGITQAMGSLVATGLVRSYIYFGEQNHIAASSPLWQMTDSVAQHRIQMLAKSFSNVVADPAARTALGVQSLSQQLTLEARILAYDDTFQIIAFITLVGIAVMIIALIIQFNSKVAAK